MYFTPKVSLVSISNPTIIGLHSAEDLIAYTARVSNPGNQMNTATAPKLLAYLIKNKHWSPFEMVHMTIEIQTTRDIARQILRHRSFSFQEFSQRYADVGALSQETILRQPRLQDFKNRQASIPTSDKELIAWWQAAQSSVQYLALEAYKEALARGIAKEQARVMLPEGLTPSRVYMSGVLRSWIHYLDTRRGNGTQSEHSDIADIIYSDIFKVHFPAISEALDEIRTKQV